MRDWPLLSFADAVLVNPHVSLNKGQVYPFVAMADVDGVSRSTKANEAREYAGGGSRFQSGDTLMARITPCLENGKIARYRNKDNDPEGMAHGSTEFIVIRGRPDVTDSAYAYYLTQSEEVRDYAIGQMTGTSGRQRVPIDALNHCIIPLPPLPEQRAIAHILGTLDDKIELNRRINETLEEMARALFKSWFVNFDPVRTKMEGRWRPGESLPGLPSEHYDLFPDRLVDSELGEIPEGWEVSTLGDVVEVNPKRLLRKGEIAPYLDMANMPTAGHIPDSVIDRAFGSGMRFINGDTLLARITPCLENGKTAFVDFLKGREVGWGSTEYIVLRPRHPLPVEFGYYLARDERFREFAIQGMSGTSGRQRVSAEALSHYLLPLASEPVVRVFGKLVQPLMAKSSRAMRESRTLAAVREALLPKLVSGEIRVEYRVFDDNP